MLLTRLARFQLAIFGVVTVICLGLITTSYLHLPAAIGLGVYKVDAKFVVGGGIYQNANVTYRGVTIGRVTNVGLSDNGVTAQMRLNTDTPVPDNVTATVKSVSAIGEQYIDLVPPADPSKNMLKNGATIGVDRTAVGQDIVPAKHRGLTFDFVVTGVPLLNFPVAQRISYLESLLDRIPAGRPVVQLTYGPMSPIPPGRGNYTVEHFHFVLRNIPPTRLWIYRRPAN
ncbi:hypothetical protein MAUB1S_01344 [Mycolicibacterium aubagnense]